MDILNNSTNRLLESALNASMTRQRTISNNIANADTPNYKARRTVFGNELSKASGRLEMEANRTDHRHLQFGGNPRGDAVVVRDGSTVMNNNGNNVDMDREMAKLAENQLYYQAISDRMHGRFQSVQTVLGKGR
ncbi:flagellar basal body rod protein FlgB [Alteribacter natronophilus]|uniref:flagellar basal body rod protein FlgB n=1 Tax=Alteribacter natronophilus TaxID=2583810 RepID=UPI00110F64A7|nr:flagellar basal body rod protein FlgB [Alteribacter natronophilus]TMW73208.1 flagellar basal body rod protein FlgB [Alteribacter natronophilus]